MDWAPRCNKESLKKLDVDLKQKIKGLGSGSMRRNLLEKLRPTELLHLMTPPVYIGTKEEIIQRERTDGARSAAGMFLDKVTCYNGWGLAFLDALYHTGHESLVETLCPDYSPPSSNNMGNNNGDDGGGEGGDGNDGGRGGGNGVGAGTSRIPPPKPLNEIHALHPNPPNIRSNDFPPPYCKEDPYKDETVPKTPYSPSEAIWMQDQQKETEKIARQSAFPNNNSTRKSSSDSSQLQYLQSLPISVPTDATAETSQKEVAMPAECPGKPKTQSTSASLTPKTSVLSASQSQTPTELGDSALSCSSRLTSISSSSNSDPDSLDDQRESRMNILEDNVDMNITDNNAHTTSFNNPITAQFQSSVQVCNPHSSTALFDDKSPISESLIDNFKTASLRRSSLKEEMKLKSSEKNDETESLTDSQIQESDTDTEVEPVDEDTKEESRSMKDDIAMSNKESKFTKQEPKDAIFSFPDEGEVLISDQNQENVSTSCLNSSTNQTNVIESDSNDTCNQIATSESTTNVPQNSRQRFQNQIEANGSDTIDNQNQSSAPMNSSSLSTETTASVAQNSRQNHVGATSLGANVEESRQSEFSPPSDPVVAIHDNSPQESDNDAGNPLRQVVHAALKAGFWVADTYDKYYKFFK